MTVKSKLLMILGLLLVVFAGTSLLTFFKLSAQTPQLEAMEEQANQVATANVPLLSTAKQVKYDVVQVQQWLTDISATRAQDGLNDGIEVAAEFAGAFKEDLAKAKQLATELKLDEVSKLLAQTEADFPPYHETGVKMANTYIAEGPPGGNKMMEEFDAVAAQIGETTDKVTEAVSEITGVTLSKLQTQANEVNQANAGLIRFVLILTAVGVIIALGGAIYLFTMVGSSLDGLEADIEAVASQDASARMRLDASRQDEFGVVARALADFREKLAEVDRMKVEQAEAEKRSSEERREMRLKMASDFEGSVGGVVEAVSSAAKGMKASAETMSATAQQTSTQTTTVAAASEQASTNVQTVASAAEELSASISEISRQVAQSSAIAGQAVNDAHETDEQIQGLAIAANKIGEVVALITDIADQTNLLALNATIEAARAGDAGKGFAVVASEVKNLANQTAKATEEIGNQIGGIQTATENSVAAIQGIGKTIGEINDIASAIAAAVEEQGAATQEIARNVEQAAAGTQEVSTNIAGVTLAASETGQAANQMLDSSGELSMQSDMLKSEVDKFLMQIRSD